MWVLFLALAIIILLYSWWQHKLPPSAVLDMFSGIVPDDPQTLADAAGVDLDTYSLARAGQSEEGISSDLAKISVMYAVKNHADRQGKSITEIVTAGNPKRTDFDAANGRYGRQGIHPYCTTIAAPSANTLLLAQSVMDGTADDQTQGAQWFDNPYTQDVLHAAQPHDAATGKGYYSSAEIATFRSKTATLVNIDGVSTRFWK